MFKNHLYYFYELNVNFLACSEIMYASDMNKFNAVEYMGNAIFQSGTTLRHNFQCHHSVPAQSVSPACGDRWSIG